MFKAIITLRAGGGELRARSEGGIRDKIRGVAGKFFNGRAPPADNDRRCFSAKFVKDKIFEGVAGEEGKKDERRHGGGTKITRTTTGHSPRFYARDLHTIGRLELER